jgi:hypothetical protein
MDRNLILILMKTTLKQTFSRNWGKVVVSLALVGAGVLSRTLLNKGFAHPLFPIFGNNFEIVTVVGVLAGYLLGIRWGWVVPLAIMVISDRFIGNDAGIIIFTWTGFVISAVLGGVLKKLVPKINAKFVAGGVGGSLLSVLLFFAWTNFGVWLQWYPKTIDGIIRCYTLALPFLANQLKGNLIIGSIVFGSVLLMSLFYRITHEWAITLKTGKSLENLG